MTSPIWSLPGQKACGPGELLGDEFPLSELCHRRNSLPGPQTSAVDLDIASPGGALTPLHTVVDGGGCWTVLHAGAGQVPPRASPRPQSPGASVTVPGAPGKLTVLSCIGSYALTFAGLEDGR